MEEIREFEIEEVINISDKTHKYDILIIVLFSILQLLLHSTSNAYPIFFKKPKIYCFNHNNSQFDLKCELKEMCDQNKILNKDFIIESSKNESFLVKYNIYCDKNIISVLESGLFVGNCLGLIIAPLLINKYGPIKTLKLIGFIYVTILLLIQIFDSIIPVTICFYCIFSCTFIMYNCKSIYLVEMIKSKRRSIFHGILEISSGLSGIYVVSIIDLTKNLKSIFFLNMIFISVFILLVHWKIVESIRYLFQEGKSQDIFLNLEKIWHFNGNVDCYHEWRNKINLRKQKELEKSERDNQVSLGGLEVDDNNIENELKINEVNFCNILQFKSQLKTLIIFTFVIFIIKQTSFFLLLELSNTKNTNKTIIPFLLDTIVSLLTSILIENPRIGRKFFTKLIMIILGVTLILSFVWYSYFEYSLIITIICKMIISAGLSCILLFNFESYSTLTRATSSSFNKFFAMFFNIFTPFIANYLRLQLYLIMGILSLVASIFVNNLSETQGKSLKEFPDEYKKK